MHRIDHVTRALNANGAGKDGFTGGNPALQIAPTTVTPDFLNALQEELANAITAFGGALVKTQNNQLASSLALMFDALALGTMSAYTDANVAAQAVANDPDGLRIVVAGGIAATYSNALMHSADGGKTFQVATFDAPRNFMTGVAWGNGQFVAVGSNADIRTSPDGATWTKRTPGGGYTNHLYGVQWVPALSLWIAIGRQLDGAVESAMVQTSPDGITWTRRYLPGSLLGATRLAINGDVVHAIAGSKIYRTTDGINWFDVSTFDVAPTARLAAINTTPGGYLALGADTEATAEGRYGWRSADGLSWVRQNLAIGAMTNVRIVARTGAIIGARTSDGALAIAMPSGVNYAPAVAVVPGVGSGLAPLSMLFRTDRHWVGRVNNTLYVSPLTLY